MLNYYIFFLFSISKFFKNMFFVFFFFFFFLGGGGSELRFLRLCRTAFMCSFWEFVYFLISMGGHFQLPEFVPHCSVLSKIEWAKGVHGYFRFEIWLKWCKEAQVFCSLTQSTIETSRDQISALWNTNILLASRSNRAISAHILALYL